MDNGLVHSGLTHQLLRLDAVLLGPLLKVQVVEQAHHGPELPLVSIAQLLGVPAHHMLHRHGVAEMKGLVIILGQQVPRLLSGHCHSAFLPVHKNRGSAAKKLAALYL